MELSGTLSSPIYPKCSLGSSIAASRARCRQDGTSAQVGGLALNVRRISGCRVRTESLVVNAAVQGAAEAETVVSEPPPRAAAFKVLDGRPMPFGATPRDGGVNFAVYSSGASSAYLCLFTLSDLKENRVTEQIQLDPLLNKTGDVWHVFLQGEFQDMLYGYKFDGKFCPEEGHYFDKSRTLLDPYAKTVISRQEYGVPGPDGNCWPQMAGMIPLSNNEIFTCEASGHAKAGSTF